MSKLQVEELQALSVPQLKKYAAGVEGEDLELVNSVIKSKETRKDAIAQEANAKLAELAEQRKAISEAEAEAKIAAMAAREELKAAALAAKAQTDKLKAAAREATIAAKAEADALKAEAKLVAKAAKAEADAMKEEAKAAKLLAIEEAKLAKVQGKLEKEKAAHEKFLELQIELQRRRDAGEAMPKAVGGAPGENKSETIRSLYAQGMTNEQIAEASGFTRKLISDTVWGIKKKEAEAKFLADYRAKKAAEAASEEIV